MPLKVLPLAPLTPTTASVIVLLLTVLPGCRNRYSPLPVPLMLLFSKTTPPVSPEVFMVMPLNVLEMELPEMVSPVQVGKHWMPAPESTVPVPTMVLLDTVPATELDRPTPSEQLVAVLALITTVGAFA